jgi:hypothetical protein
MQVAGNENDIKNIVRKDITLKNVPFGLKSCPAVVFFGGWIGHHRGKDDFPFCGRAQQTGLEPLQLSSTAKIVAVEHTLSSVVGIPVSVTLTPAVQKKEIRLRVTELLPNSRTYRG